MNKEITSKVLDDAREKAVKDTELTLWFVKSHPDCDITALANRIFSEHLALSGTTDIECLECGGLGFLEVLDYTCPKCDGFGVIKHPWKVRVVLENGELPKSNYEDEGTVFLNEYASSNLHGYNESRHDMIYAGYRQVVE